MKLYYPITVDLYNPHPLPRMNAQQHNVGRGALITLTANGQVIVLDEETVRIFAKRPDKNTSYLDCSILEGKIQADFTDQMLASEGIVEVELELTTAETNITTPIFIVEVNKSNVKEGVQSSNEYKALEKYTAEAKEAAEQAQEVYDNIPNYEAILEANSILSKASGEVVTTTDSAKVKPKNIKLFGKGKQNIIPGNQLIPYPFDDTTFTSEGISCTDIGDGSIYVKGTSTDIVFFNLHLYTPIMLEAGEYSFIAEGHESGLVNVICYCPELDTFFANGSTFVLDTEREVKIWLDIAKDVTVDRTIRVMLNRGGIKPWEPYVGGEQSPNVRYPQKAEFLGESGSIVSKLLNANVYNPSQRRENGSIRTGGCTATESNGVYSITATMVDFYIHNIIGKNNDHITDDCGLLMVIPDGVAQIGITLSNSAINKNLVEYFDINKISLGWSQTNSNKFTSQVVNNAKYFTLRFGKGDAVVGETYETTVMVNYGEPKDYEPYTEQPFTPLTPNGLRGIPLGQTIPDAIKNSPIHMNGVYWDGEQYQIADTKNENGKDVQRVLKVTIDGNSDVFDYNNPLDTSNIFGFSINGIVKDTQVLCDKLTNRGVWSKDINGIWVGANNAISIRLNNNLTGITTEDTSSQKVAKVKELLTNNPIEIYYWSIIEPIITDTTEEEKAQLDALVMNYPNTTIVNDAGAYMEVEYVCDTKEHIKQNYTPNSVTEDILERLGNVESQIALNS